MKTIYLDVDGVLTNWNRAALKLIGLDDTDPELLQRLANGRYGDTNDLEAVIPEFKDQWDKVDRGGYEFWANLELLPWAHDLVTYLKTRQTHFKAADLLFVTSPGKWAGAGMGKMLWQQEVFPDIPICICKEKHLLAAPDKILIDDKPEAIVKFEKHGGRGFVWPNQYKLLTGRLNLFNVISQLEHHVNY